MAQSLQIIALKFTSTRPNLKPVWSATEITVEEGVPSTTLLSKFVSDPDPDYPGATPLEIDVQSVNPELAAMGVQVVDLGRDVEIRYDGRPVGATPAAPRIVQNAFVGVASDGVPDGGVSAGGGAPL